MSRPPTAARQLRIDEALGQIKQLAEAKAAAPKRAPAPKTKGRPRVEEGTPRPARIKVPPLLVLRGDELNAIWNNACHELGAPVYQALCMASTLDQASPQAGHFLVSYKRLQDLLRRPKPEKGQWKAAPTRKTLRGAVDALESAGLVWRDKTANQDTQQLRGVLLMREKKRSR